MLASATGAHAQTASLSKVQDGSSTVGLLEEAQQKNMFGQDQYVVAASILSKQSMVVFSHGSECASSCPGGCCDNAEAMLGEAAMLSLLGTTANDQARAHRNSAMGACHSMNQMLVEKKNCKAEISAMDNFVPQPSWYNDDGECTSKAPAECKFMEQFNYGAIYLAKTAAKTCGEHKNTPCGSVTTYFKNVKLNTDGTLDLNIKGQYKKMTLNDFSDAAKLKKLGFSSNTITELMKTYKQETQKLSSGNYTGVIQKSMGQLSNPIDSKEPSNAPNSKSPINAIDNRNISSVTRDHLFKQIDGDPIGFSDQDIFKMINNRYQNDSFLDLQ